MFCGNGVGESLEREGFGEKSQKILRKNWGKWEKGKSSLRSWNLPRLSGNMGMFQGKGAIPRKMGPFLGNGAIPRDPNLDSSCSHSPGNGNGIQELSGIHENPGIPTVLDPRDWDQEWE